jgi:hypothetical protein
MGILTDEMKPVLREERLGYAATVCPDGTPRRRPAPARVRALLGSEATNRRLIANANVPSDDTPRPSGCGCAPLGGRATLAFDVAHSRPC